MFSKKFVLSFLSCQKVGYVIVWSDFECEFNSILTKHEPEANCPSINLWLSPKAGEFVGMALITSLQTLPKV